MKFFTNLKTWFAHSAWPGIESFLGGMVHSEVEALAPIARDAVAQLSEKEAAALASGHAADMGAVLKDVVNTTVTAAANAGMEAGAHSVLAAVGAALPPKE